MPAARARTATNVAVDAATAMAAYVQKRWSVAWGIGLSSICLSGTASSRLVRLIKSNDLEVRPARSYWASRAAGIDD